MNWQIHSGLAAFGNIPPEGFNLMSAMSLKWSADLPMLCTKIVLTDFGFGTALPGLNKEWDELNKKRLLAYGQKMYDSEKTNRQARKLFPSPRDHRYSLWQDCGRKKENRCK